MELMDDLRFLGKGNVSILGWAESNLNWYQRDTYYDFRTPLRRIWPNVKFSVSSSGERTEGRYQPGGTITMANQEWSGRVVASGRDELGRWSSITIIGKGIKVTFITAYLPGDNIGTAGNDTWIMQLWRQHRSKGVAKPNPRLLMWDALETFILSLQSRGDLIVLMMDANGTFNDGELAMNRICTVCNLKDPHAMSLDGPPQPSYARGSKKIDFILVSEAIVSSGAIVGSGTLALHHGIFSDHTLLFIDLDERRLLRAASSKIMTRHGRILNSRNQASRRKYQKEFLRQLKSSKVKSAWRRLIFYVSPHAGRLFLGEGRKYDGIDTAFNRAALCAEKACGKSRFGYASSPALKTAAYIHRYYRQRISAHRLGHAISPILLKFRQDLNLPDDSTWDLDRLNKARKEARLNLSKCQLNADELRRQHLEILAEDAAQRNDTSKESALKCIMKSEQQTVLFDRLRVMFKGQSGGAISRLLCPDPSDPHASTPKKCTSWIEIHDEDEICRTLLEQNHAGLLGANATPLAQGRLKEILGPFGLTPECDKILDGTLNVEELSDDPVLHALLRNWQHTDASRDSPPIDLDVTRKEWCDIVRNISERKSSSPSGVHLGHAHVWTRIKPVAQLRAEMDLFPHKHGFAPTSWKQIVDVMLEKTPGFPFSHKLRLIALLESKFNISLRALWPRRLMPNADRLGLLGTKQKGGRSGFQTYDCLLMQILSMSICVVARQNAIIANYDSKCFDRILLPVAGLLARRAGAPSSMVRANVLIKRDATHRVQTAHGLSSQSYSGTPEQPLQGEGQGCVNAGESWNLVSASIMDTHAELTHGMSFQSVDGSITSNRTLDGFVDDNTGGNTSRFPGHDEEIPLLLDDAKEAAIVLSKLLEYTGGLPNLDKTALWAILHSDSYRTDPLLTKDEISALCSISLPGPDGNEVPIPVYGPNDVATSGGKPAPNLGVLLCPSGNMSHEYERRRNISLEMAGKVVVTAMSRAMAFTAYQSLWFSKIRYVLPVTTFSKKQCTSIAAPFLVAILPAMGYHRLTPRDVLYGPYRFGGQALFDLFTEQGIDGLKLLIGHLRSDNDIAQLLLILLSYLQLIAGTRAPYLQSCAARLPHVPATWLGHLRYFMSTFRGSLLIDGLWIPTPPRHQDVFLMDSILDYRGPKSPTDTELLHFNACRMYIRASFLSCITTPNGRHIASDFLDGNRRLDSTWNWPDLPRPPARCWRTWRRWLKRLFSPNSSRTHRVTSPMKLSRCSRLGAYHTSSHHVTHEWYYSPTEDRAFHTETDGSITQFRDAYRGDGTYARCSDPADVLPPDSLPATIDFYNLDSVQLHRRPRPLSQPRPSEFLTFRDFVLSQEEWKQRMIGTTDLTDENIALIAHHIHYGTIEIVSDAGVRNRYGAHAFLIVDTRYPDRPVKSAGPVDADPVTLSSFRAELSGILGALILIDLILEWFCLGRAGPITITIVCDNISALERIDTPFDRGIRYRLIPEYDLINELHDTLDRLYATAETKHVKGHQDDKQPPQSLSIDAQRNVDCDKRAGLFLDAPPLGLHPRQEAPFLPSSKAALRINNVLSTTHMEDSIRMTINGEALKNRLMERNNWTIDTLGYIDWDSHGSALSAMPTSDQVRLVKFLNDWLPTQKRNHRYGYAQSPNCPICSTVIEEQSHVISCPHPHFKSNLTLQIQQAKSFLKSYRPFPQFWNIVSSCVCHAIGLGPTPSIDLQDDDLGILIRVAIDQQTAIGWEHFLRGRIASAWGDAQDQFYREYYQFHRDEKRPKYHSRAPFMVRLVKATFRIFLGIWSQRNAILHDTISGAKHEETLTTIHRIYKYHHYYLTSDDMFLLDLVPLRQLDDLSPYATTSWLSTLLTAVRARHKEKTTQLLSRDPNHTIDQYFQPLHLPHPRECNG